ncbi:MAG: glutathione S-transferase C-terminal domain-containing protein, partial [Proteobacteria bacterium]|nr:glutathione S-transferase C-terminal domain-containing protein [Pseudomonadota bacterium]
MNAYLVQFYQSGRGRLSWDEVEHMGCAEIDAVVGWLGEQDYLFGARPSSADCAVYAFLQGLIYVPFENGIKAHALAQSRLRAYAWPEFLKVIIRDHAQRKGVRRSAWEHRYLSSA